MQVYMVIFLLGCSLVSCGPVPAGHTSEPSDRVQVYAADSVVPPHEVPVSYDGSAVSTADVNDHFDDAEVPSADVPATAENIAVPCAGAANPSDEVHVPTDELEIQSADAIVPYDDVVIPSADAVEPFVDVVEPNEEAPLPVVEDSEITMDLFGQGYPEAAYEEGSEVDYETSVDVVLDAVLGRTVNVEAPSPFGQGINGEDGPNSVLVHIADLPAGIPFEADFETDVNVDVADSSIHTINVKVKPHAAYE